MLKETKYLIVINMFVGEGYVETGRFFIGQDMHEAMELFRQLDGNHTPESNALLRLDFTCQNNQGLDTVLQTLGCTLSQVCSNVKIIIRETFRMLTLE